LYGADCAVLLAAVPALADVVGSAGLVFLDAHEDATTVDASTTGEAANMEVAFLTVSLARRPRRPVRDAVGVLRPEAIAMLGMRDENYRREIGVSTIADRVRLRTADAVHVLAGNEFSACGAASDPSMQGGLSWTELSAVVSSALRAGGCRGWNIGVYNPDLDPERRSARQIVDFVAEVATADAITE
jgi:arginase